MGGGAGAGGKRARATIRHFETVIGWSKELTKWFVGLHDGVKHPQGAIVAKRVQWTSDIICRSHGAVIGATKSKL